MPLYQEINIGSFNTVNQEIAELLNSAKSALESYVSDGDITDLAACRDTIKQLDSTFNLMQCRGASLFCNELSALADHISVHQQGLSDDDTNNKHIALLTQNLFILPRYLEYIQHSKHDLPILLLPYINECRIARREPILLESQLQEVSYAELPETTVYQSIDGVDETTVSAIRRYRHMYQFALVAVLTRRKVDDFIYTMLKRPLAKFSEHAKTNQSANYWLLADAYVGAIADKQLELTINRKRNLAEIDKQIRKLQLLDKDYLVDEAHCKELLFCLALLKDPQKKTLFKLPEYSLSDQQLVNFRAELLGPGKDTIIKVTKELKEELAKVKSILEICAEKEHISESERQEFQALLNRSGDTIVMLNLPELSREIKHLANESKQWQHNSNSEVFEAAADSVLLVDSSLQSFARGDVSASELNQLDLQSRHKIIADNQFAQAEVIVLKEAASNIALAKRAITSYVDTNFDIAHIANVAVTLKSVYGGLNILGYNRAAKIVDGARNFINKHLMEKSVMSDGQRLLEALADALISLEYYVDQLINNQKSDDKVLEIAEESLAEL